jgi:beta-alanine degradation protein BauB
MSEVGTTKIIENDKVILWEFVLEPGESTPVHTHKLDYLFYVLEGTTLEVFDKDNKYLGAFESKTGYTFPLKIEGDDIVSADDKGLRFPATHSARNAGPTRYREILVETKR